MNQTIQQLSSRKSIRQFTGQSVSDEDLNLIMRTAQRCPTSVNGQQISLVYTRDKEIIKKIAKIAGGQMQVETADVFICVVADFNRTSYAVRQTGDIQNIDKSAEGIIVGAVDAGIMACSLQVVAESLGYGTTMIGGIRNNPMDMIELLKLPKKCYPVVGTTIGVATKEAKEAPLKPRIPFENFAFEDKYDNESVKEGVLKYEVILKDFRVKNNMDYMQSYCEQMSNYYKKIHNRKVAKSYQSQGFEFLD